MHRTLLLVKHYICKYTCIPRRKKIYWKNELYDLLKHVYENIAKMISKIILGYSNRIQLGYSNVKIGREQIYKHMACSKSLHGTYSENGMRVISFALSTTFPHKHMHWQTWVSEDWRTANRMIKFLQKNEIETVKKYKKFQRCKSRQRSVSCWRKSTKIENGQK